jgi:hypothetical protein
MTTLDTLRSRLGFDLREFAGAAASGEIPVPAGLVNRLIAERLASNAQIASLHIEPQPDDSALIRVVPRTRLVPSFTITARIERQPEFPDDPRLLIRWSLPAARPLALLAGPVLSYFKRLPPGVRLDGDRVVIDLREVLRSRGLDDVSVMIRRLTVHSQPGGFRVRFQIELPTSNL